MEKSSSERQTCLCAPSHQPGPFRCRYHRRNSGLGMPRGIFILSMLAGAGSNSDSPKT
ncbi:hypothetical protein F2Q70_00037412 [Brassica cretica]|uniref:Uncharacterized protein n=1 Tax=Brassica cretica TaxID=69181 RepID=A0A8S9K2H2_BRACR|nr:hypothetical protein F2Q70_00037412 [Brassica cretica]